MNPKPNWRRNKSKGDKKFTGIKLKLKKNQILPKKTMETKFKHIENSKFDKTLIETKLKP